MFIYKILWGEKGGAQSQAKGNDKNRTTEWCPSEKYLRKVPSCAPVHLCICAFVQSMAVMQYTRTTTSTKFGKSTDQNNWFSDVTTTSCNLQTTNKILYKFKKHVRATCSTLATSYPPPSFLAALVCLPSTHALDRHKTLQPTLCLTLGTRSFFIFVSHPFYRVRVVVRPRFPLTGNNIRYNQSLCKLSTAIVEKERFCTGGHSCTGRTS